MGNSDTKLSYRAAIIELTSRHRPAAADDEAFWSQFWHDSHIEAVQDVFALLTAAEIRTLREQSPANLATLCYKAVEQLVKVTDTLCNTVQQQKTVLTCVALLTRVLPYIFEDPDWRAFFWNSLPSPSGSMSSLEDGENSTVSGFHGASFYRKSKSSSSRNHLPRHEQHLQVDLLANMPLAQSLLLALSDLLFCPDFTVAPLDTKGTRFGAPDTPPEDLQSIDSCEYIWEAGVGCSLSSPGSVIYDHNRTQLLRLLLTCFSESMYCSTAEVGACPNAWVDFFSSAENRHALPLFTSLLNTVFAYNPNASYLPFNHLLFSDSKEPLVEVALQILIVILDHDFSSSKQPLNSGVNNRNGNGIGEAEEGDAHSTSASVSVHYTSSPSVNSQLTSSEGGMLGQENLFINYISRIHREDDFELLLRGFTRLLNNPLAQSYLPNSNKRISFHQELLVLFWKLCDYNKKFMYYVLKTCDVLKILVPILYHLNDARADRSRVGLVHIGVFIILLLSGERNFGVRLNRPYLATAPMDLPIFSGTHADLLVIVFHKLITTGHQRLQPLFDCLLTILVNVSPYLKTLSMVASAKILHLLEAFSTPWFLFSNPTNHHLVFFLLEIFNNIIQYQFDGNANLMYTIIRKRHIFHGLANLPTDYGSIQRSLNQAAKSASVSGGSVAGSSSASSSSSFRRSSTKAHRKLTRPLSLIETNARAACNNPDQYPYAHSQYMAGAGGAGTGSKSNPASPQTPTGHHHHFEQDFDLSVMGVGSLDLDKHSNLETPPSQSMPPLASGDLLMPTNSKNILESQTAGGELMQTNSHHHPSDQQAAAAAAAAANAMNVTLAAVPKIDKMTEKMHPCNVLKPSTSEEQYEPEYEYRGDMVTPLSEIVKRDGVRRALAGQRESISRQSSTASERTTASTTTSRQLPWSPTSEWIQGWKQKLPLQTIMRMLQVRMMNHILK